MNKVTNPPGSNDRLRLALVSTPRSGNTWLRNMLAGALELHEHATHRPSDVDWDALPERLILHIHWHRREEFVALLEQHGFRVVVICRHSLDVLLSLLTYVQHSPNTASWLDGLGGDERDLDGASPLDAGFVHYGTGPRRALLEVGTQWWSAPDAVRARYEDLVDDPHAELTALAGRSSGHGSAAAGGSDFALLAPSHAIGVGRHAVSRVASPARSLEAPGSRRTSASHLSGAAGSLSGIGI